MKNTKSNISPLAELMIAGLCLGLLAGCSEEPVVQETKLRPVKFITTDQGETAIRDRVFSGTTHATQEVDLSFKVSGTVKQVAVAVGGRISKGDLIAELDSETYRVELEQARASLANANAARRNAEAEYQRVRQLYTNNNASQNELDSALASTESAKAAYNADAQSVRLAKLNLQYTQLKLKADTVCSAANVSIEPNENVTMGTTVAQVNCGDGWEVKIAVPESLIGAFQNGLRGSVQFASLRGETFDGIVTEVGTTTGGSTIFPVTLLLDGAPPIIRSGLAAEVTFQFSNHNASSDVFYLAPEVVGQDETGTFVYVIEASNVPGAAVLRRRSVDVGEISELGLEILNGLGDGERVVVAGHKSARDGLLVRDK